MKRKGILGGIVVVVLILVLTLAVGGSSVSAEEPTIIASGNCGKDGSNVTWTLDSTGLLTISGEGEMEDYSAKQAVYGGSWWVTTAPWSSYYKNKLIYITIESGVTSIGSFAFRGCTGLTSVTIPNSVTSIGENAFEDCTGLTSVTIPNSVTSIGYSAFEDCTGLLEINYNAEEVELVLSSAPVFCNAGTDSPGLRVVIGDGVRWIPDGLFNNCKGLTSVTIPDSVTSIGDSAFCGCEGLTNVTIPDGVTSIGWDAFDGCTGLANVTIGNSVTSIGHRAFRSCKNLTSVTIPDSVTSIGSSAFSGCTGLISVTIGNSVTSIGDYTFSGCADLTSVEIPNSVTSIGDSAFWGCTGLASVAIPDSVTSIGKNAFEDCTGLTSMTIPNSVTSIGRGAFEDCTNLTSVTIPYSVNSIGGYAFYNCTGLAEVYYKAKAVEDLQYNSYVFTNAGTSSGGLQVVIGDGVEKIPSYLFYGCTGLSGVTIGTGVTSIGWYAFGNCKAMTELKYNAKVVTERCVNVFYNAGANSGGIDVTFGEKVKKLPMLLFSTGWNVEGSTTGDMDIRSITFTGDAPATDTGTFGFLKVCAFYPYQNETWTASARQSCSEYLNWKAYSDAPVTDVTCKIGTTAYLPDSPLDTGNISVTVTHEDGCVETIPYNSRLLELGSYDMSTTGEKVIDVTYKGHTAQLKVYVHEKKTETLDKEGYPESSHDYENDLDKTYTYKAEGAFSLDVTFSAQTEVETNIDYLYVNGTKYTGTELAGKTLTISGDTLKIRLVSDKSDSAYGFSIDSIVMTYMGHEYEDTIVPPTCTEQGYTLRTCPCGNVVKQNYVDALGHDMVTDAAVAPTCTETGLTEGRHCSRCDRATTAQKVVPALGHDKVTDAAVAPTCTETGLTEGSHCGRCDETITAQRVVPALGHNAVTDAAVAPTCTESGLTEGSHCSRCDETITAQKVAPALGHDIVIDAGVAPTCTEAGLTEGSHCSRCDGATTARKVAPALGHDMVTDAAVAPTCTKTGLTEGSHCSRCDETITAQKVLPALGHHFNEKHICEACGVEDPIVEITLKKLPAKTSYVVNKETLDVTGGVVLARYESGETEEVELTAAMVSGFDSTVLGKQTLTVTVGGLTTTFEVEVVKRVVTSVSVENGKLVKHYSDGTTEETALADGTISEFVTSETGEKTLTLSSANACVAAYKDAEGNYVALKAVANADGSYSYVVPEGVTEVTVAVKGDLDGDGLINMKDLARLRHDMADGTGEDGLAKLVIDLDGDGQVNMKDLGMLRRYLAGGYNVALTW